MKWNTVAYCEEKYFVLNRLEHPRQDKNLLYLHNELNQPPKEGHFSYVRIESPSASIWTPFSSLSGGDIQEREWGGGAEGR